jgi:two-component system phosphate regulon sensor histidine kinase PhoR
MKRLLEHLVFNAFYYSNPGAKIRVELSASDHTLVVSDSGIGMSEETIAAILRGPYRDERGIKYHQKGSGIGFQIVFDIVKRLHAKIDIQSVVNVGTTIRIQF